VSYSEPVFRHTSEVAAKMRTEITDWVSAGKPDRDILDAYEQQYGDRVFAEPEGSKWWWVNIVPSVSASWCRSSRRRVEPSPALAEPQKLPDVSDLVDEMSAFEHPRRRPGETVWR
jgi:cytochrome c-type biogenesis protein CcmH/NrfF